MRVLPLASDAPRTAGAAIVLVTAQFTIEEATALANVASSRALAAATTLAVVTALPIVILASVLLDADIIAPRRAANAFASLAAAAAFFVTVTSAIAGKHRAASLVVAALFAIAAGGCSLVAARAARAARERKPEALVAVGLSLALLASSANRAFYPRLYPVLHYALAVAIVVASVVAAHGLTILRGTASLGWLGALIASWFLCATPRAAHALSGCEPTRRALHENSELLRPVVRWSARLVPPRPREVAPAMDPLTLPLGGPRLVAGRASVLLITVDALRADHVGAYGYARRPTTPNLDALAARGVVLDAAYTAAPQTSYALASLMTGCHARAMLDAGLPLGRTWPALLAERGYATAAFYPEAVFFTDRERFRGLEQSKLGFAHATVEYSSADERAGAVQLFVASASRPFFAWAHFFEPHEPYDGSPDFEFGDTAHDRYDADIAVADRALGRLVRSTLEAEPNTLVIVTADHGEAFGEHGAQFHGTTLYEEQVRVPLIIHAPWVLRPRRLGEPMQTIDLLPTIAHALDTATSESLRGRDVGGWLLAGEAPGGTGVAFASLGDSAMLAVGHERLLCQRSIAACAVFDLRSDPLQHFPIESGDRLTELRSMLEVVEAGNRGAH